MSRHRLISLVALAMVAFAANSLLCRLALKTTTIDPGSFTVIRIVSGAAVLWALVRLRGGSLREGSWLSAAALFAYAAGFSFAYLQLATGVGALLLFCAVQVTMIGYGVWNGEKIRKGQGAGIVLALAGLVVLMAPGMTAPPVASAGLMLAAGGAWGVYSLRGKGFGDPSAVTAGNFLRAVPFAVLLSLATHGGASWDSAGILYAAASGAIASGCGYALWYAVLPSLSATGAATIQLSVPVIAAAGGVILLGEAVTARLLLGSAGILGGIALVIGSGDEHSCAGGPSSRRKRL